MTEKELGDLTWANDPSFVFTAKTWKDEARLKKIKRRLKFDHMFLVPWIHKRGGGDLFYIGRSQLICEWRHLLKTTLNVSLEEVVKELGGLLASLVSQLCIKDMNRCLYFVS